MSEKKHKVEATAKSAGPACGIVMPISAIDDCSEAHWADVQEILSDSIEAAGFAPNLVSHADDVGIIQKRIIQNLYENPIIVCDVSGKNPNVMFELGIRLAFDKPTIIVKDDKTSYSFDTAPIEHLEYPRDLRFGKIVEFKEELVLKIKATHEKATTDAKYTTFLKHFGTFTVAKLDTQEVSKEDYILEELRGLRQAMAISTTTRMVSSQSADRRIWTLCVHDCSIDQIKNIVTTVKAKNEKVDGYEFRQLQEQHFHAFFSPEQAVDRNAVLEIAKAINPTARWIRVPRM